MSYFLYAAFVLSLGSYSAALTVRWPANMFYLWRREAHDVLSLPFLDEPNSTSLFYAKNKKLSHCPHCHHKLSWHDLIPLFSYFFLKRRCRYCKQPISKRYPAIEFLHLVLCAPLLWLYDDVYELLLHSILFSALITAAIIDAEHKLIPDECCGVALASALLINLTHQTLESSILGLLIGYIFLYVIRWLYHTVRNQEGIGLGDVKLVAVLAAWLGLLNLAPLLLCASLSGILYNGVLNKKDTKQVPFGPFLIFSAILVFYL
jgi:leader peptidase (prepilin peptidase)/N-methyltransferase